MDVCDEWLHLIFDRRSSEAAVGWVRAGRSENGLDRLSRRRMRRCAFAHNHVHLGFASDGGTSNRLSPKSLSSLQIHWSLDIVVFGFGPSEMLAELPYVRTYVRTCSGTRPRLGLGIGGMNQPIR
jgi:hypothetical protein